MIEVVFLRKWPFATAPLGIRSGGPEGSRIPQSSRKVTAYKPDRWEAGRALSMSGGQTHHHTITAAHAAGKVHLCLPLFLSLCLFLFLSLCSFSISYSISFSFLLPVCFHLLPFAFGLLPNRFPRKCAWLPREALGQGRSSRRPRLPYTKPQRKSDWRRASRFSRSRLPAADRARKAPQGIPVGIFKEFCAGSAASP